MTSRLARAIKKLTTTNNDTTIAHGVLGKYGAAPIEVANRSGFVWVTIVENGEYRSVVQANNAEGAGLPTYEVGAPVRLATNARGEIIVRGAGLESQAWAADQGRQNLNRGAFAVARANSTAQIDGVKKLNFTSGVVDDGNGEVTVQSGGLRGLTGPPSGSWGTAGRTFTRDTYNSDYELKMTSLLELGSIQLALETRSWARANPGVTAWEMIEARVSGNQFRITAPGESGVGIGFRATGGGEIAGVFARADGILYYEEWSSDSIRTSQVAIANADYSDGLWLRFGTTWNSSDVWTGTVGMMSGNGVWWGQMFATINGSTTSIFNTNPPDQVFFGANHQNPTAAIASNRAHYSLEHWVVGWMLAANDDDDPLSA